VEKFFLGLGAFSIFSSYSDKIGEGI